VTGRGVQGYTEVRVLGSGGFGEVVLARHDASGTLVAVKYLRPTLLGDAGFAGMFREEARVLASLDDPNVVRLYEYVESAAGAAIVMELIDGVSLRDVLARQGATSAQAALVVLVGSLRGLAAAHAAGVVHRDYKPANVLVDGAGASKLTDFGIAARAGDRPLPAGTLAYAPPEQLRGGPASPAGDVYAATATFYECLAGRPPFTAATSEELLRQHLTEPVPLDAVPDPLRPLVITGMAKDPRDRPADAAALLAQLQEAAAPAYGPDWEQRGRGHLAEAALLLAALWPSSTAPAVGGQTVEQVHLSHPPQPTQDPPHVAHPGQAQHAEHLQHVEHLEHAGHAEHLEHVQHIQHAEHLEHVDHLAHFGQPGHAAQSGQAASWQSAGGNPAGGSGSAGGSGTTAGSGSAGGGTATAASNAAAAASAVAAAIAVQLQRLVRAASRSERTPHWLRRVLPRDPGPGVAIAVVAAPVVALIVVVAVIASALSGSSSAGSLAGAWSDGTGDTFTFTPSGSGSYTIGLSSGTSPRCTVADDGTVTGSDRRFQGSLDLYPQDSTGGTCPTTDGTASITIELSADGKSASVDTVAESGGGCSDCGQGGLTRQS